MEYKLERFIDSLLESISQPLLVIGVVTGISLIIFGIVLITKKSSKKHKSIGLACIGFGLVAILSESLQLM